MDLKVRNAKTDVALPLRMALYGELKTGKTTFISTCPKPFIMSVGAEAGVASLGGKDVDYAFVNTAEEAVATVRWFKENYKKRGYRTFGIDTTTVLGRIFNMQFTKYGEASMEYRDWTKFLAAFLNIRDTIHTCDVHVVWNFHVDEVRSGDIVLRYAPKLQGASLKEILAACGVIGYLEKSVQPARYDGEALVEPEKDVRRLWVRCPTDQTPSFMAGTWYDDAFAESPCYLPTFDTLMKRLAPRYVTP